MKIVHIIPTLNAGGAEKLIIDSVPLYQKSNINVDVLSLDNHNTEFRKLLMDTTNGEVYGLTLKSVYNPLLIFRIIPFFKKYDIIHTHLFPVLYWAVLAKILSFSKVKIIYTEHNTSNKRRNNKIFKLLDQFMYGYLDFVGCITDAAKKNLEIHLNSKRLNIKTIQNGIDIQKFTENNSVNYDYFDSKDFVLIQISSFRAQKDQETLIKSLKYLPNEIKLLLVGEGELKVKCENLVHELQLDNRVMFLGLRTDIPSLLHYANVSVQSSHYEGFGLVAVEAMASGIPCVASNVEGLKEVVEHYGILFEKGNSEDLAEKIIELYTNQIFYEEVSSRCLSRANDFDIRKMVEEYITVYKDLLYK